MSNILEFGLNESQKIVVSCVFQFDYTAHIIKQTSSNNQYCKFKSAWR